MQLDDMAFSPVGRRQKHFQSDPSAKNNQRILSSML